MWVLFLNIVLASGCQPWNVRSWCGGTVVKPSVFIRPILQAASGSLSGARTENCPASHFTEEETEAQRTEWHCHSHKHVFVIKHGFHPWTRALQLALWHNTFLNSPFLNRLLSTQSQSYFKHQFRWHCDLLESIENFGVEHIFLLRTSSQINNYLIAYSDDCVLFDLFFSKLFNSLRPKSLCSDLNKEIGAAGFETEIQSVNRVQQVVVLEGVSTASERKYWVGRLELHISHQGAIVASWVKYFLLVWASHESQSV